MESSFVLCRFFSGGPAPEDVTNAIYKVTTTISQYKTSNLPKVIAESIAVSTVSRVYTLLVLGRPREAWRSPFRCLHC